MRGTGIRLRLVIGSSLIAGLLIAAALGVARIEIAGQLHDSASELAHSDLASYAVDLRNHTDETPDPAVEGQLILITNPTGVTSVNTMPHDVLQALQGRGGEAEIDLDDDEGRSYVIVRETVDLDDGTWVLWAARDVSSSRAALRGIDLVFAATGLALLAVMALASWILVRRAFAAVEMMRQRAAVLAGDELLPVSPRGDELDELAETLNGFVQTVRDSTTRERRMVSDAAHELRTPLAGLRAELELLEREGDIAHLHAGLARARGSAERLGALATNLLELSRLDDSGAAAGDSTATAIASELLDAVDRARLLASAGSIDIVDDVRIADGGAHYAIAAMSAGRIADNLLANAIRASDGRGTVTLHAEDAASGLRITVADHGGGIDEQFLPRAFDRFSRASDARTDGGAGLGLALVAAIAAAAGGSVSAVNRDGGLVVTVLLPKM